MLLTKRKVFGKLKKGTYIEKKWKLWSREREKREHGQRRARRKVLRMDGQGLGLHQR